MKYLGIVFLVLAGSAWGQSSRPLNCKDADIRVEYSYVYCATDSSKAAPLFVRPAPTDDALTRYKKAVRAGDLDAMIAERAAVKAAARNGRPQTVAQEVEDQLKERDRRNSFQTFTMNGRPCQKVGNSVTCF